MRIALVVLLVAPILARGGQAPPSPTPTEQPTAETPRVELKRTSTFAPASVSRNPFWPIGYRPTAKVAKTGAEHSGPEIPDTAFAVTSIALDAGTKFAIINGKAMTEGQQFGLKFGSQIYQITVKTIQDGQVILSRRDQDITVLLRRK